MSSALCGLYRIDLEFRRESDIRLRNIYIYKKKLYPHNIFFDHKNSVN